MKKLTLLLLMFCAISLTFAQTNEKKIALVIGNANYQHGGKLKNPVNDANLIAKTLQDKGFTVIKKTDATLAQMQMATVNFTKKIKDYDVALFYYAGHVVQVDGNNYLVPVDANLDDKEMVSYLTLNINDVNDAFNQNTDNINIMILDACRNDPFASWERGGERGFKKIDNSATGTIIAFATQPGATAADGDYGNGLYTSKLVEQIKKPQSIEAVFKQTRIEVNKASGGKQVPQEWSSLMGDFYFTKKNENNNNNNQVDIDEEDIAPLVTYGNLEITNYLQGSLYIDGKYKQVANKNKLITINDLPAGTHNLKIVANNETWQQTVSISTNQTYKLTVKPSYTPPQNDNNNDLPNVITDSRDGKTYKIVEIGDQVWMAENLAYKANSGCWAYDDDNSNVAKYGYLYNFETAKNVCPNGYHLPTDDEWTELADFVGDDAGKKLKATSGWDSNGNGVDEFGFSALPGGYRSYRGSFYTAGYNGGWWSSTAESSSNAWFRSLGYDYDFFNRLNSHRESGFSVRCVGN